MKIIEKIFDIQTGEETVVERDENAAEIKSREALQKAAIARQTEATAKAAQRRAILEHLKITEEEARILLGGN
jgi:hypothetical protein